MNKDDLDLFIQTVIDSISVDRNTLAPQNRQFRITADDSVALCREVQPIFEKEKTVLDLVSPINICGDIHGQLGDLVRCLQLGGFPPFTRWLFLGDFVDRGPYSVEVITLLFALKIRYPNHIYLIRGNHESPEMTEIFGFMRECVQKFDLFPHVNRFESQGEIVWMEFCSVFEYIPVAAIVANDYLCIHGGISPLLEKVQQIRELKRPLKIPLNGLVTDLFWSDPSKDAKEYGQSERGSTCVWGLAPLTKFLKENKLKCLIRGHQFVVEGFDYPFAPDRSVITMFTASNYAEGIPNKAAFLVMDKNGKYEIQTLPQFPIFSSSPQLSIATALEAPPPKEAPIVSNHVLSNSTDEQTTTTNVQPRVKVRQMINHSIGVHRRSLPLDKDRRNFITNSSVSPPAKEKATSNESNKNTEENEATPTTEDKITSLSPNNNAKENKSSSKKPSLSINNSNSPNSRSIKSKSANSNINSKASKQIANSNKNSNQSQVASPPKVASQSQLLNATKAPNSRMVTQNNKINANKRISGSNDNLNMSTNINGIQVMNNLNIPNLNIPTNVGLDLSSLDPDPEYSQSETSESFKNNNPASPPNVNRIHNMPSLSLVVMEQNKVKKNESSFPKPPPLPASARTVKANPYHSLAANARMVNEVSPLVKSVDNRRNNESHTDDSILRATPKSVSKSSVSMTPPQNQKGSLHTPPKPKRLSTEYTPTPRPNISKTRKTKARSNSLKY